MKRDISARLLHWKNQENRKPLIIKGARQVGKTYAIQHFGKQEFQKVHYFNFEKERNLHAIFEKNLDPTTILNQLMFVKDVPIGRKEDLVIFDEIQECPAALTSLKYFSEEMPELAICSAGSLLGLTLQKGSFPVGKVEFLQMFPCSFMEFLNATDDSRSKNAIDAFINGKEIFDVAHEHIWEQFKTYLVVGGLPESILAWLNTGSTPLEAYKAVRKVQENLLQAYQADMAKHSGKVNAMHIERLWRSVPAQLGRSEDGFSRKFTFKEVIPGLKGYSQLVGAIDWLIAAGMVLKIPIVNKAEQPLNAFSSDNTFKLFMFDVGMLGAMADLAPQTILDYQFGLYKGFVAENFVAQELVTNLQSPLYSWKEQESEVEFLQQINAKLVPIEVKAGSRRRARSLDIFWKKYKPEKCIILSGDSPAKSSKEAWRLLPLYLAGSLAKINS